MVELRKIESQAELDRKSTRRTRILTTVMLLILIGSTFGAYFGFREQDNTESNSGIQNLGNEWAINFNGEQLLFSSPPNVTKDAIFSISYDLQSYYQQPIYVSSENRAFSYEIGSTLGRYSSRIQEACYGNCTEDLPEKTCDELLIVVRENNENKITQNDNCVFIDGDIKTVDAFLYRVFGLA
jgi:hypothetical protein